MSNAVNLGLGKVAGMFFHAPEKTALPVSPFDELGDEFKEVGYVSEDGPSWTPYGSTEVIRDWSRTLRRRFSTEKGSVSVPVISTTAESLKTVFGAANVTTTAATAQHGQIVKVDTKNGPDSTKEAFVLIGEDAEDGLLLMTDSGMITDIAEVGLAPNGAIIWNITIEGDWQFVKDDGQKTS